jgi:NAD(P)-dependent dehydrogenase (short-subunit alcohol dehydrogenase family)
MGVCIVGASGKLGRCMVQHALDRGYEVVGVCRPESVEKLSAFKGRITVVPGATNDAEVIKTAVLGCDGCSLFWYREASTGTRRERPKRCSTMRLWTRASCSRAVAHHARRPGCVFVEAQGDRKELRPARTSCSLRLSERPGGGVPKGVRQRHAVDGSDAPMFVKRRGVCR